MLKIEDHSEAGNPKVLHASTVIDDVCARGVCKVERRREKKMAGEEEEEKMRKSKAEQSRGATSIHDIIAADISTQDGLPMFLFFKSIAVISMRSAK